MAVCLRFGVTGRITSYNVCYTKLLRILTGGVIYHYMVGYGGGRKSILPGVSSLKTIQQSHMWAMEKTVGKGSNPLAANIV